MTDKSTTYAQYAAQSENDYDADTHIEENTNSSDLKNQQDKRKEYLYEAPYYLEM